MPGPEPAPAASFDSQAAAYDRRAGLPAGVAAAAAAAVVEVAGLGAEDLLVEVGAGTGQIGARLAAAARYAGLDLSLGMLAVFRERLAAGSTATAAARPLLLQADGTARWPFADGSARALFASRAIHHLDPDHAAAEADRVAQPAGAVLLVGRVRRDPEGVRAALRREMRRRLAAAGVAAPDPESRRRRLLEACCGRGAELIETRIVSRWPAAASPRRSLSAWAGKPGLAGTDPPPEVKSRVLAEVEEWAAARWGDLDREHRSEEAYALEGVRFPAR